MKRLICIIEDDAAVRNSLRLLLELHGYGVEAFEEGGSFLARGILDDVLCLILDLNLRGELGTQIVARLRTQGIDIPAFIMTGRVDSAIRREAQRLGVRALFEKPFCADELLSAIDEVTTLS